MSNQAVLKWTEIKHVIVVCGTAGKVSNEKWEAYLKDLKTKNIKKCLSLSAGTSEVTSVQRAAAADILKKLDIKMAVVTDESLIRGMVTAASWLGADIKAFSWSDLAEALKYLEVPAHLQARVMITANSLKTACNDEYAKQRLPKKSDKMER